MKFVAHGWAVELPALWQDRSMITLVRAAGGGAFAPNIVVLRQAVTPRTSIEEFAAGQREATRAELPGLEVLDERPTTVAGAPAYQRLQRFTAHGQRLQQAQTYVLRDATVFVITCTATLGQFNEAADDFRRVVDSFRFFDADALAL